MAKQKREDWFKHQFRAREDEKLIRLKIKHKSSAPIGVYWQLVEMIYENDGYVKYDVEVIAYQLGDSVELVQDIIDDCFEKTDANQITHHTIITQLELREQSYQQSVEKGTKGANKRWGRDSSTMEELYSKYSSTMGSGIVAPMGCDSRVESREMRDESREFRDKGVLANSLEANSLEVVPETPYIKKLKLFQIEQMYPDLTTPQHYEIFNNQ